MATNGFWTLHPTTQGPKRDWFPLFNASSDSQGKAQLGLAWVRCVPLPRSTVLMETGSGKRPWLVHVIPAVWGSWSLCACWMFSEEGRRVAEMTKSQSRYTEYVCNVCFFTAAQPCISTQTSLLCRELDNLSGGDWAGDEPMSGHTTLGLYQLHRDCNLKVTRNPLPATPNHQICRALLSSASYFPDQKESF